MYILDLDCREVQWSHTHEGLDHPIRHVDTGGLVRYNHRSEHVHEAGLHLTCQKLARGIVIADLRGEGSSLGTV